MKINFPLRLQKNMKDEKITKNSIKSIIKCDCCESDTFLVYKNSIDKEKEKNQENEKKEIEKFLKKHPILSYVIASDKEGRTYLRGTFFDIPVTKKIYLPETFDGNQRIIVKAKCVCCNNEVVLYDSFLDGYDAIIENVLKENTNEDCGFEAISDIPQKINVQIYNYETFEEFKENTELKNIEDYYNGYGAIKITLINPQNNRRNIILNEETR